LQFALHGRRATFIEVGVEEFHTKFAKPERKSLWFAPTYYVIIALNIVYQVTYCRSVLFLFYLFDLIVPMYPSLKSTDKYYYGYYPEHSNQETYKHRYPEDSS
jgi:hypothetical protein